VKISTVDVAILGAGPYGLSIAAHLSKLNIRYRIFGAAMQSWRNNMPQGMFLKSEGFASDLYDPDDSFTLRHYCRETQQPYADVGVPVPIETFTAYGLEFQKRLVPDLESVTLAAIRSGSDGFDLRTDAGEELKARRVVVAAGITYFAYLPPELAKLPPTFASHSSRYSNLSGFRGRQVAVVGAGSSAVDLAALLQEAGAEVTLIARARSLVFHDPSMEPRARLQRLLKPRSELGLGWRSLLCTDAPLVFHAMPAKFRLKVVSRHLGPSVGWFVKEKFVGHVKTHLGVTLNGAEVRDERVHLALRSDEGEREVVADHVIGGTGYRVALQRLGFLDEGLRRQIRTIEDSPVLSRSFESSVPGLYFVGVASASSFGPLARFACGAKFTARQLTRHLAAARR
jgi:cation diffusion facilitator CzcD-associated flavoprotein CzcO